MWEDGLRPEEDIFGFNLDPVVTKKGNKPTATPQRRTTPKGHTKSVPAKPKNPLESFSLKVLGFPAACEKPAPVAREYFIVVDAVRSIVFWITRNCHMTNDVAFRHICLPGSVLIRCWRASNH